MKSPLSKYRLNQPATAAIAQLRSNHGIEPTFDEVVCLNEIGKQVLRPSGLENDTILNIPIRCGNMVLRRLTIAAEIWLSEYAIPVCEDNDVLLLYATAYASVHANDAQALREASVRGIAKTVAAFAETITADIDELENALVAIVPQSGIVDDFMRWQKTRNKKSTIFDDLKDERGETSADGYGPVIAFLMREYGRTPEYWLFEVGHDEALYYMGQGVERIMRENGEKASVMAPMLRAQRAMMVAVNAIVEAHKEKANG